MKELSIVIPAYNEEDSITETLNKVIGAIDDSGINYEIVVVNDGSKDNTGKLLEEYKSKNYETIKDKLKIITHKFNKGYGAGLKTGIRNANSNNICITDADGTYPIEKIPSLYKEYIEGSYDMVVGKRPFKKLPLLTKPAKWFITALANYLVTDKIEDINSGLRIFKKDIAQKFFNIISDGFSFTTTITLAMMSNSYNIKYTDIDYHKRKGKSKIKPIRDTLNFIQLIIRTVMYFNPLKIFLPLFFILIFAALGVFFIGYFVFKTVLDSTIAILTVGALQVLATGMIADLVDKRTSKD